MIESNVQLGKTEIRISPIGLGIMQWGNIKLTDQKDSQIDCDIHEAFQVSINAGINLFDTAEMYGSGKSEIHLGTYLKEISQSLVVATKFMPFPWRLSKGELRSALLKSLDRLGLDHVDLYYMHWPFPPVAIQTWMDAMADAFADGLIRAVGVSNYSPIQTSIAYEALAKHNIPLAANQVKYNLLDRRPERSSLVDQCKKLGVTLVAYSPLEKGILTGKFNIGNLPSGWRAWRYNKSFLARVEPLIDALRDIGQAHMGKTAAMVALNWLMCKGAVPIPGARNKNQALENAGALGWQLNSEEVSRLDKTSSEIS